MLRSLLAAAFLVLSLTACASPRARDVAGVTDRNTGAPSVEQRVERTRLEILGARALLADGRYRSAQLAFGRAERELPQGEPDLARQILHGRGDAAMALGDYDDAARHYREAATSGRAAAREHVDLQHAIYLALRESGDPSAERWKQDMPYFSQTRLSRLERELLFEHGPFAPISRPTEFAGSIPSDPRALLASIRPREDWKARPISGDYDAMTPITHATVHHSAMVSNATGSAQAASELRDIQSSHQAKWADIGYHFVIDPAGRIWEGRELRWQGAHEGTGLNQGAIGICLLGNFERRTPARAQLESLGALLDACSTRFGLTAMGIKTHREVRREPTACPGRALQSWVDGYRRQRGLASLDRQ